MKTARNMGNDHIFYSLVFWMHLVFAGLEIAAVAFGSFAMTCGTLLRVIWGRVLGEVRGVLVCR